jgi:hypothetical protein
MNRILLEAALKPASTLQASHALASGRPGPGLAQSRRRLGAARRAQPEHPGHLAQAFIMLVVTGVVSLGGQTSAQCTPSPCNTAYLWIVSPPFGTTQTGRYYAGPVT